MAFSQNLTFTESCSQEDNIEIIAVGDVLLHSPLQIQATRSGQRYKSLWAPLLPIIQKADIAYANLEGAVAPNLTGGGSIVKNAGHVFDNKVLTSYPMFNYHPSLVEDLKSSGFDVVSTANNHSLDRRSLGVDLTIKVLQEAGLPYTGTRTKEESQDASFEWHTITEAKGRRIAWLACTFSTNGIPDKFNQVLPCFQNTENLLAQVTKLSNDSNIDAVIVTPHWGEEYKLKHNSAQSTLAKKLLDAGALAVIGTHPHVVQPWEKYITKDGRETFVIYSTGNFVSGQPVVARETSVMVQLNLTSAVGSKLKIRGVRYLPLYMKRGNGHVITPIFNLNSASRESQSIWLNAFGQQNRIESLQENAQERLCNR